MMAPTGGSGPGSAIGAALREAAARGDSSRLTLMLQTPASASHVNDADENGCTALQRAAADGHSEVVKLLLQHGSDPSRQDILHGNTALHEAAWKGYSRCVALLSTQSELHTRNSGGFAPLHLACQNGHNQTCREILLAGCDPDIQNNYGDTSLHTSARYGHAGVTRILISAECHVSDQNKNGDTALHIAAAMGRRKLTRILLEAGSNKQLKNKQNETAQDIAVRKELSEIVDILSASSSKARKDGKKKEKERRDKSKERAIDVPDGLGERSGSKRSKEKEGHLNSSPNKHKDKKKTKNVHFESNGRHWSPYGCHYYPDPKNFPKPNLDSLPKEPLKKGEQYYLDLAGNICKGPVGVGYTCYCAPFFRHMEDKLNRDKQEIKHHIDKAHEKLDQKVTNLELRTQGQISELTRCVAAERVLCRERQHHLEQWLTRGMIFRASERVRKLDFSPKGSIDIAPLKRTRSLEMLDATSKTWNIIRSFNDNAFQREHFGSSFQKSMRSASKSADILEVDSKNKGGQFRKGIMKKDNSKSTEFLDASLRQRTLNNSARSSNKSLATTSATDGVNKFKRVVESPHNVIAEIHVKSSKNKGSESHGDSDNKQVSESDDKYSSPSKRSSKSFPSGDNTANSQWLSEASSISKMSVIANPQVVQTKSPPIQNVSDEISSKPEQETSYMMLQKEQNRNCLVGIENDGYVKIPKHSIRCDDGNAYDHSKSSMIHVGQIHDESRQNLQVVKENPQENLEIETCPRKSVHELVARIQEQQFLDEIERVSRLEVRDTRSPISRPLSPSYQTVPHQQANAAWQTNSIPLSDSTHFNTIEPINQTTIQHSKPSHKTPQAAKSPEKKKFSFHNLIPFPSRKMFNFQHKSDGNRSESSDEEDAPIRSTLEPGLMQNSNLLTTLPLPNYENMISGQNAQPQIPYKTNVPNGHYNHNPNNMSLRGTLLPIPKDAYFHEIPNRQRLHDNPIISGAINQRGSSQYNPLSSHMHIQNHPHFQKNTPLPPYSNKVSNENFPVNYGRSRNPVYSSNGLLSEMMHDHIDREMARTPHSYTSQLDENAEIEISNINNPNIHSDFQGRYTTNALMNGQSLLHSNQHYQSHGHLTDNVHIPLESNGVKHNSHEPPINDNHFQQRMQNLAINTHLSELQSQLDRDSHNDSGYSTKVYGSSQGASPSLSGNVDCTENVSQKLGLAINRNIRNDPINRPLHSHLGASSLV